MEGNVLYISDIHAPRKNVKVKSSVAPWITRELRQLMRQRDQVQKAASYTRSVELLNEYRVIHNKVNTASRKSKHDFINRNIIKNKPQSMWKAINLAMNNNRDKRASSNLSAKKNNEYFTQVGPYLGQMFDDDIPPWLQNESLYKFTFNPVSEEFIVKELKKLPNKHKLYVLGFESYLLRNCAIQIAPAFTYFINLFLMSGTVPPELKMAQVTPIFKNKGSADLPENYRPISVVSHLAKILEKAVCHQLMVYLTDHHFITPDQSAFLKGHSTQTALHKVVDDLLESTDGGLVSCLCFFDIKKCFDCIQHQVLLHKMTKYGILGLENKWFNSFLSDRQQITIYNNVTSEPLPVTMGIPQGSVLGPALFLLLLMTSLVLLNIRSLIFMLTIL